MKNRSFFVAGALLLASLFTTSCKELVSNFDQPVKSYLTVAVADLTIPTGDTDTIKASSINSDKPITYKSSDESVAIVDENGVVTGVADGEAVITVSVEASENYLAGEQEVKVAVKRPLTFEAKKDGIIQVYFSGFVPEKPIVYAINKGAKQEINSDTGIDVKEGDKVQFESANETLTAGDGSWGVEIMPLQSCAVYGNVMSMISPDGNYHTQKAITKDYALKGLLYGTGYWEYNPSTGNYECKELYTVSHEKYKLTLPATTLTQGCYNYMLAYTGLTEVPELPATVIPDNAYQYMFDYCLELTEAPALNLESVGNYGCSQMYESCKNLKKAGAVHVKNVGPNAFRWTFDNCKELAEAPAITAETVGEYGLASMFYGCEKMKKANDINVKDADSQFSLAWMFSNCTALEKAPTLSFETLGDYACYAMFYNCQSLEEAPALPATNLAPYCYAWMFESCTNLKKAPALSATELKKGCYNGMFSVCVSLAEAPELKAESLPAECYMYMFQNCYKLSKVTCMAKEMTGYNAISNWLYNAGINATIRTFNRSTENNNWVNTDNDYWAWDTTDWCVPNGWTITPAIEALSAPAAQSARAASAAPSMKLATPEKKDAPRVNVLSGKSPAQVNLPDHIKNHI